MPTELQKANDNLKIKHPHASPQIRHVIDIRPHRRRHSMSLSLLTIPEDKTPKNTCFTPLTSPQQRQPTPPASTCCWGQRRASRRGQQPGYRIGLRIHRSRTSPSGRRTGCPRWLSSTSQHHLRALVTRDLPLGNSPISLGLFHLSRTCRSWFL